MVSDEHDRALISERVAPEPPSRALDPVDLSALFLAIERRGLATSTWRTV